MCQGPLAVDSAFCVPSNAWVPVRIVALCVRIGGLMQASLRRDLFLHQRLAVFVLHGGLLAVAHFRSV